MKLLPAIIFTAASLITAIAISLTHESREDARTRLLVPPALQINSR